jgi:hypothetical protein
MLTEWKYYAEKIENHISHRVLGQCLNARVLD